MPYTKEEYPGTRDYICEGFHNSRKVLLVESLEVEICLDPCCAKLFAKCTHQDLNGKSICTWNENEDILSCTFCNMDVT